MLENTRDEEMTTAKAVYVNTYLNIEYKHALQTHHKC